MSTKKNSLKNCSTIILAAGNSSRMNSPKFALKFDKKNTFLEKIIREYHDFGCEEIIVVLNKEGKSIVDNLNLDIKKAKIVINQHPEWERFYSIKQGAKALSCTHSVFIHNVDNPFVTPEILESLISQDVTTDYVIPTFNSKGGHPILISNKIHQVIILEERNDLILSDFLKKHNAKRVTVSDDRILLNINTKKDYRKFLR